jgi:hypothetical protein
MAAPGIDYVLLDTNAAAANDTAFATAALFVYNATNAVTPQLLFDVEAAEAISPALHPDILQVIKDFYAKNPGGQLWFKAITSNTINKAALTTAHKEFGYAPRLTLVIAQATPNASMTANATTAICAEAAAEAESNQVGTVYILDYKGVNAPPPITDTPTLAINTVPTLSESKRYVVYHAISRDATGKSAAGYFLGILANDLMSESPIRPSITRNNLSEGVDGLTGAFCGGFNVTDFSATHKTFLNVLDATRIIYPINYIQKPGIYIGSANTLAPATSDYGNVMRVRTALEVQRSATRFLIDTIGGKLRVDANGFLLSDVRQSLAGNLEAVLRNRFVTLFDELTNVRVTIANQNVRSQGFLEYRVLILGFEYANRIRVVQAYDTTA